MFSRAFLALRTPAWRSASTFVVFPGAKEDRRLGEVDEGYEEGGALRVWD